VDYSVIVPVFNCKAYLTACVESICRALPEGSQLLLVDDGSTDGSGAMCDALAKRFSDITVLHQENRGAAAARNAGLRKAAGRFILFADADDRLDSEQLGQMLRDFSQSDADMGLFGLIYHYYYRGKCYRSDPFLPPRQGILLPSEWDLDALFQQELLSPLWNKIFRRDILAAYDLFLREDMAVYEDLEFALRYLAVCGSIFCGQKPIYHYRQAEDEGNAGRRLGAAASLWDCVAPVAAAMVGTARTVPAPEAVFTST